MCEKSERWWEQAGCIGVGEMLEKMSRALV